MPKFDKYTIRLSPRLFASCLNAATAINKARQVKASLRHRKAPPVWDESDAIASILENELLCRERAAEAAAEREAFKAGFDAEF